MSEVAFTESGNSPPVSHTLSQIIARAGGRYVGIEDLFPGEREPLVLFNSPQTGTTLGLPLSQITVENVFAHIGQSNRKFGVFAVSR